MADDVKPYTSREELEADLRRHREPPETLSDLSWSYIEDALYDRLLATARAGLDWQTAFGAKLRVEKELRREWWLSHCAEHGGTLTSAYGDDGEMQCSVCVIDFRRWSANEIRARIANNRRAQPNTRLPSPVPGTDT